MTRASSECHPPAIGQDELGQEAPVLALVHVGRDREPPRFEVGALEDLDTSTGPTNE